MTFDEWWDKESERFGPTDETLSAHAAWSAATARAARIAREAVAEELREPFPRAWQMAQQIAVDIEGDQPAEIAEFGGATNAPLVGMTPAENDRLKEKLFGEYDGSADVPDHNKFRKRNP